MDQHLTRVRAQEVYREKLVAVGADGAQEKYKSQPLPENTTVKASSLEVFLAEPGDRNHEIDPAQIDGLVMKAIRKVGFSSNEEKFNSLITNLFKEADEEEMRTLIRLLRKFVQSN